MPTVAWVLVAVAGGVGTLQGAAWLGAAGSDERTRRRGAWLTPVALLTLAVALARILMPDFFR